MSKKAWFHVGILYLAGMVAGMQFTKLSITMEYIQVSLGVGEVYSSWMLSAISSMGMIFGATVGVIVGRFAPLKLLAGALWSAGVISFVQPLLSQPSLLMASRVLESFTQLIIVSAAPTAMLMCTEKKYQTTVMALWSSFFSVAFLVMNGVAPMLLENWGWTSLFYSHGAFSLSIALGITILAMHNPTFGRAEESKHQTDFTLRTCITQHKEVYRRMGSALPSFLFITYTMVYLVFLIYTPMLFQQRYGGGSSLERILVIGMPIMSLVGTAMSGGLLRCKGISPFALLAIVYIGMIGSTLVLMVHTSSFMFVIMALIFVTGSGVLQSTIFGIIPYLSDDPTTHAYANGGIAQLGSTGTTLGAPIFAILLTYGWSVALLFPIFWSLVGISIIMLFSTRIKAHGSLRSS